MIQVYKNTVYSFKLISGEEFIAKVDEVNQTDIHILNPLSITLTAQGGGVAGKTGAYLIDNKIRKLTPRECARLQGFPDSFTLCEREPQSYKQLGNAVSVYVCSGRLSSAVRCEMLRCS